MSVETFTFLHVVISLVGIMTGFIVVGLMLQSAPIAGWNAFFLISTILTSVTRLLLSAQGRSSPAHIVGAISLVILAVALFALYGRSSRARGAWSISAPPSSRSISTSSSASCSRSTSSPI